MTTASTTAASERPLLELKGVTKRFGAVEALTDVDFEVDAGEVVALVGDNGAGKSTLIKAIAGIQPGDEGELPLRRPARSTLNTPQDATRPRDRDRLPGPRAVRQPRRRRQPLPRPGAVEAGPAGRVRTIDEIDDGAAGASSCSTRSAVTTLRSVRTEVGSLSGGQRQSVAIARSLLGEPKIVILDEPTAALGVAQTQQVLDLIKRLRERGLGVVLISHNLADVFEVADRIVVLRLGRRVATFDGTRRPHEEVVGAITGRDAEGAAHDAPAAGEPPGAAGPREADEPPRPDDAGRRGIAQLGSLRVAHRAGGHLDHLPDARTTTS